MKLHLRDVNNGVAALSPKGYVQGQKEESLDSQGFPRGALCWTRTSDPIDVNDVL
jgi:hypothetical protein